MAIPDFQTIMRPLLASIKDGEPHSLSALYEKLSADFNLTDEEKSRRINSGRQTVIRNRVGWARTYLHKAGLLTLPKKGHCQITDRGHKALEVKPERIDNRYLKQFPEFVEFQRPKPKELDSDDEALSSNDPSNDTPEEALENAYRSLTKSLGDELLQIIKQSTPLFFEQLVVDLMLAMGYGGSRAEAGKATQMTADGGIDGIINEDRLGLDTIYLQAKRWEGTVGRPEIQKFAGALQGFRAKKGVFITTSDYSSEAREFASNLDSKIVLINGQQLTELMIESGLGVTTKETYTVKSLDSDYFNEE